MIRLASLILVGLLSGCANTTDTQPETSLDTQQAHSLPELSGQYQVKHKAVELFFKKAQVGHYVLSPDGEKLGYLARDQQGRMQVFVSHDNIPNPSTDKQLTRFVDQDLDYYLWLDNHHIGYLQDKNGDENFHLYAVDISSGLTTNLTPYENTRAANIQRVKNQPGQIHLLLNKQNKSHFLQYSINIKTKKLTSEYSLSDTLWAPIYDDNGNARIKARWHPNDDNKFEKLEYHYRGPNDLTFRPFVTLNSGTVFSVIKFNDDKNEMIVRTNHRSNTIRVVKFNTDTFAMMPIISRAGYDILSAGVLPNDTQLSWVYYQRDKGVLLPLSQQAKELDQVITEKFSKHYRVISLSDDGKILLLNDKSPQRPGRYAKLDTSTLSITTLPNAYPWLNDIPLAEVKTVQFMTRDGRRLNGLLTMPNNAKKSIPVVIHPHGGPFGVLDKWEYNPETQLLASQGYGVLQINYRGSGGYGRSFVAAGFHQFGTGSMQHDITDGVEWLIEQGIADPKRVMIYGASYGGYATLAGLTFTPDLYACGVDYVGISNLHTFLMNMDESWGMSRESWLENVGNPYTDIKKLKEISPYYHVDKIKAPLFVAQGAQDPRVKQQESDQIVNALRKRGVEVKYMLKQDEGHGFDKEENQQHFYDEMIDFLASCPANNRI
ncbi:S9 family peptidase [Motilimonas sp. 1_MG-2023]|uniref:S9 family peptidase n=1 Tax=Motilimonas sp. 1_MG-2023 TaxID=3062672 RepID=UPI0026E150D9|nr:S9 family peptidase [Motilimonas sp. 1_MG-2023]MDO6525175.1 S9 family peptidase [Motilimonas sp. 1_MG-2023]